MTRSLLWKLVGVNVLIIGFVIVLVWVSIDYLAAGYFAALMAKYNISPVSSHQMFVDSVHRNLIWASLAALLVALALSFLVMRRLLGPLTKMTKIAQNIAAGDYSGQVPITSRDEVGRLAGAFNSMAEGLRFQEELRKRMMIDVAHELRTPITNIRGYLEGLMDGVVPPSKEAYELLHEETMRLAVLVEDILHLAQADAARWELRKSEASLAGLIDQVLTSFRPQFEAKRLSVQTDFPEPDEPVRLDSEKIVRVVSNLAANAVRYSPSGGVFRIALTRETAGITAVFSNEGVTISEKDLPFIFERFYRGEKSRSREHGGAGIGLAIVKELVEAHDGRVGAEISGNETRIWFFLPL
ncbi:MAG: HAMP domain-containing protein [Desulfomonile tiedjei]|nr:HAMP domain-containing protein [Desulfomonile tiedjei]